MEESSKRIADGLRTAIQMESDGNHFYIMAANSIADPKGKMVFLTLADEELRHGNFLRTQYKSIIDTGTIDTKAELGPRADLSGSSPIFSPDILPRIKKAQAEMSALSIGITLELASMSFYDRQADNETDPGVKAFYKELASWESNHYQALLRQQDLLKEDFWAKGGFAPF